MAKTKPTKLEAKSLVGTCQGCGKSPYSSKCLKRCAETIGGCRTQIKGKNN